MFIWNDVAAALTVATETQTPAGSMSEQINCLVDVRTRMFISYAPAVTPRWRKTSARVQKTTSARKVGGTQASKRKKSKTEVSTCAVLILLET